MKMLSHTPHLRTILIAAGIGLAGATSLAGCGAVDAAGSIVGGAVDLTVDAVDTTTDVVTAPL